MRGRIKKRRASIENLMIAVGALVTVLAVTISDKIGMPQKWHAAIAGTVLTFGTVISVFPRKWPRWSFWIALGICLVVHLIAIGFVFQQVLSRVQVFGILLWAPIAFLEALLAGVITVRLDHKLAGDVVRKPNLD